MNRFSISSRSKLLLAIVALCSFDRPAAETGELTFGVPKNIISGLSGADAKITIQSIFGQALFDNSTMGAKLYEDQDLFLDGIRKGEIAGAVMRSVDFIALRAEGAPIEGNNLTVMAGNSPLVQYVLLCKKQETPRKLSDFQGKQLVMGHGEVTRIDQMWLDLALAREGYPMSDAFFGSKNFVLQTSKALVPLFFGKTDICLVRRSGWEVMSELNPQMGSKFEVVAESPMLLETLTCLNPDTMTASTRKMFSKTLSGMHLTTGGRSLLTITKVKRFIPFEEKYLETSVKIVAEHQQLFGESIEIERPDE